MTSVTTIDKDSLQVEFSDGKKIKLKNPNRAVLGQMLAASRKDSLAAADVILNQCLIEGDKGLAKNTGYCVQLVKVMDDIFGKQPCIIEWEGDNCQVLFADDLACTLRQPTRSEYSAAKSAAQINPLRFLEDLLRKCWLNGDEAIKQSAGHLLGFAEVADEFVTHTGDSLGN